MAKKIITVNEIKMSGKTGAWQFHEHLFISKGRAFEVNPSLFMDDLEQTTEEVKAFRNSGGGTVIDAQPVGCGRMARSLKEVSKRTGVDIICSTGFHKQIFYPEDHFVFQKNEDQLSELFIRELTEGTDPEDGGFGICAGLIKTALDSCNLSQWYEKMFSSAVNAALETDRILMIHTEKGSDPIGLLDFLCKKGMAAKDLVFCHMDRAVQDLGIHREILQEGAYAESDTIARFKYHDNEKEIQILQNYLESGLEDRILLSLDTTRARLRAYTPDTEVGLDYILKKFIPLMKQRGIEEKLIHKMLYENPVRAMLL